ncbi:MAG TPA: hypothetical protein VF898_01465 [Chloroflexota bacterium]
MGRAIYFWPDPVAMLCEVRQVLRPGGRSPLAYQERERMPPGNAAELSRAGVRLFAPGEGEHVVRAARFGEIHVEAILR